MLTVSRWGHLREPADDLRCHIPSDYSIRVIVPLSALVDLVSRSTRCRCFIVGESELIPSFHTKVYIVAVESHRLLSALW
jgi:hypothetical protein